MSLSIWWSGDHVHASARVAPHGEWPKTTYTDVVSVDVETAGVAPHVIVRRCLELAMEALDEVPLGRLSS